jgi:hypothetical protein
MKELRLRELAHDTMAKMRFLCRVKLLPVTTTHIVALRSLVRIITR